jgi:formylglycine-generating enzyme required for sulfatase activity
VSSDLVTRLSALKSEPLEHRTEALAALAGDVDASSVDGEAASRLVAALVEVVEADVGSGHQRLAVGELLGKLGDPRLRTPADADYWVHVDSDMGELVIGRFPVTNAEYKAWADAGGYDDRSAWSDEGWEWLQGAREEIWPKKAAKEGAEPYVVANQPVVGVTFYEAEAFAKAHGARLPRSDERVWVVRGEERRPYPWGAPFGEGRANTREEVLNRPCAVGLFRGDRTPEGVCDLAGNVAEWTGDDMGGDRMIHPGAWDQPSMAAWAKALALKSPETSWAGLGFRLAKDA